MAALHHDRAGPVRRVWPIAFATLLGGVLFVAAFVTALSASTAGTRWLIEFVCSRSPVDVRATGISGTLLTGVRIDALHIHTGDTTVDVTAVDATWAWGASFFYDALIVDRLAAASVRITTAGAPKNEPLAIALPHLPFAFDLRAIETGRVEVNDLPAEDVPALRGRLSYDDGIYSLRNAQAVAAAYEVRGNLTLTASADVPVEGSLTWRLNDPGASGKLDLHETLRELNVQARLDEPLVVDARGSVRLLGELEPRFDVEATLAGWSNEYVRVSELKAKLAGTVQHFVAKAEAGVESQDLPPAKLNADLEGSIDAFDVKRLVLASEHGGATAHGRIERVPALFIDLAVDATDLDPGLVSPALSGALSGRIDVGVRGEDLSIAIGSFAGELNHAPFEAKGWIDRTDGAWRARDVDVRSGPNHAVMALGWRGDRVEGSAKLDLPDLSTLVPDLRGDLTAAVVVKGDRRAPDIDIEAGSRALSYREWAATDMRARASVTQGRSGNGRVSVARLARNDRHVDGVELIGQGTPDHIVGTLGWSLGEQHGSADLTADHKSNAWSVVVAEGALMTVPGELWRLDRRLNVAFVDGAFSVSAHCWLPPAGPGRLCIENVDVRDGRIRLAGMFDELPVAAFAVRFEDVAKLTGTVSGRWDVESNAGNWRGAAALETNGFGIVQQSAEQADETIELPALSADVELTNDRAKVRLRAAHGEERVLDLTADVLGFDSAARLEGHATVAVSDLGFLATFTRRVGELKASLNGEFDIGGTVAQPSLTGALRIQDGRVVLTEPRVELTSVDVSLQLDDWQEWKLRGTARSDDGRVEVTGELIEPLRETRRVHARIEATDLRARIPDVDVRSAGSVDLDWKPGLLAVKGRIEIPRATITLSELPPGAVAVSEDVIVVDRVEKRASGLRLQADLEIVLKDNVQFAAFGLSTHLTGTLRLRQSVDGVIQLNGSLTLVDGTFKAFGQTLAIDSGRLTYTGPPQDPYVDASASRTIQESTRTVKVGARIQGPARAIETTLTSDPAMSEAEALSYLVLGRPLSGATAKEGNDMMGAAIALGLKGGAPVIREISNTLGLEELTATGGSAEDLTIIAGKRFSNRIFVRYSYQTFTRMSAVLIELMLSRRLALEATASDIPAIDLIYKVGPNN